MKAYKILIIGILAACIFLPRAFSFSACDNATCSGQKRDHTPRPAATSSGGGSSDGGGGSGSWTPPSSNPPSDGGHHHHDDNDDDDSGPKIDWQAIWRAAARASVQLATTLVQQAGLTSTQFSAEVAVNNWNFDWNADEPTFLRNTRDFARDQHHNQGVAGAEGIYRTTTALSRYYSQRSDLSTPEKFDHMMNAIALIYVGREKAAGHLNTYLNLANSLGTPHPRTTSTLEWLNSNGDLSDVHAGNDLDFASGQSDFRDILNDGAGNQPHHTLFYTWASYVTEDPQAIQIAVTFHEFEASQDAPDAYSISPAPLSANYNNGTAADYWAGVVGVDIGKTITWVRNEETALTNLPSFIAGALCQPGDANQYGEIGAMANEAMTTALANPPILDTLRAHQLDNPMQSTSMPVGIISPIR